MTSKREATSPAVTYDENDLLQDVKEITTSAAACTSYIKKLRLVDKPDLDNDDDSNPNSQLSFLSENTNLSEANSLTSTPVHMNDVIIVDDSLYTQSDSIENSLNTSNNHSEHQDVPPSSYSTKETQTIPTATRTIETQTLCSSSVLDSQYVTFHSPSILMGYELSTTNTSFTSDSDISTNFSHDDITDAELIEFFLNECD